MIDYVPSPEAGMTGMIAGKLVWLKLFFQGNNFFFISGTEDNHDIIQAFLLQQMLENRHLAIVLSISLG